VEIVEDHMQQQLRDQDEALEEISIHVERIKHTGELMNEELTEQVKRVHRRSYSLHAEQMGVRSRWQCCSSCFLRHGKSARNPSHMAWNTCGGGEDTQMIWVTPRSWQAVGRVSADKERELQSALLGIARGF
jgi:hypothetical protein